MLENIIRTELYITAETVKKAANKKFKTNYTLWNGDTETGKPYKSLQEVVEKIDLSKIHSINFDYSKLMTCCIDNKIIVYHIKSRAGNTQKCDLRYHRGLNDAEILEVLRLLALK